MEKMFMLELFHLMEKIGTCIKNIGVWHSFEKKKKTATMFFLKKPFLVFSKLCYTPIFLIHIFSIKRNH